MTIKQFLKNCAMGFDQIIIQDMDSGEAPVYYHHLPYVISDYGGWEIKFWEIGFDVEDDKPFVCLLITV